MKDHAGCIRGFYILSEAYYANVCLGSQKEDFQEEVMFGFYDPDPEGGSTGEMAMRWYPIGGVKEIVPRLECFDDAFHALSQFTDVIKQLAEWDNKNIQPQEFCALLKERGFQDLTKRESPYSPVSQES